MRERLIEKLTETFDEQYEKRTLITPQHTADSLLADGWIRPPCKVGDKVYKITQNKVKECEVVFVGISADDRCSHFNFIENYADGTFYKSYSMVFDVIGKTVFLTREEAETKLKEGER
ncbi:MAG: hypothetical protein U0M02_07075 [Acutalibacteraceae bacterium]|nr:hypothetical protein [Acutalibacteraceae bacterium]